MPGPDDLRDDDVDEAGFVFEGDEGDAAGAGWSLAVRDDATDEDAGAVLELGELARRDDAECVEAVADERGGVVAGDAGGPQVGDELLRFGHGRQRGGADAGGHLELAGPI